jgi:hypothetical protein
MDHIHQFCDGFLSYSVRVSPHAGDYFARPDHPSNLGKIVAPSSLTMDVVGEVVSKYNEIRLYEKRSYC